MPYLQGQMWIGATTQFQPTSTWTWYNGNPLSYSNWAAKQPSKSRTKTYIYPIIWIAKLLAGNSKK